MRVLSVLVLVFFSAFAAAQTTQLTFQELEHDFGSVNEEDGPITHEFVFTNTTAGPVKILNVRPSCGCTTPAWTREEVGPGEKGFVKAQYNPYNRPGPFNKTLTVQTTTNRNLILRIKGNVIPRTRSVEEQFPKALGAIRFKNTSLNMNRITPNVPISRQFEVYNSGEETIKFLEPTDLPAHIKVKVPAEGIPAGEKAAIVVTYDAKTKNDFGFVMDDITLETDEAANNIKPLKVYASIDPFIPPMTREERLNAPSMTFDKSIIDFGAVQQGEKAESEIVIKNSGKSVLEIVKAKPNCSCTTVELSNDKVEPGDEVTLTVTYDSSNKRGTQQTYITIFSNDPSGPSKRLTIKGVVN